ncbi:hypothetical protein ACFL56_02940 [Candidatus Margulisiibacteriota bacterium]
MFLKMLFFNEDSIIQTATARTNRTLQLVGANYYGERFGTNAQTTTSPEAPPTKEPTTEPTTDPDAPSTDPEPGPNTRPSPRPGQDPNAFPEPRNLAIDKILENYYFINKEDLHIIARYATPFSDENDLEKIVDFAENYKKETFDHIEEMGSNPYNIPEMFSKVMQLMRRLEEIENENKDEIKNIMVRWANEVFGTPTI